LDEGNDDAALPLARLSQPPESLIFERNVQSGVNETLKKRVLGIGYREKQMADSRQPTADSQKRKASNESLLLAVDCLL